MPRFPRLPAAALAFAAALAPVALAPAALAQSGALTLQQVERKYRAMSPVHIQKCDKNGDGLYDRGEMNCVGSIYQVMYIDR